MVCFRCLKLGERNKQLVGDLAGILVELNEIKAKIREKLIEQFSIFTGKIDFYEKCNITDEPNGSKDREEVIEHYTESFVDDFMKSLVKE